MDKLARALEVSLSVLFERATGQDRDKELVTILLVEKDPGEAELTMRAFRQARIRNPVAVARDGAQALDFVFARGRYAERGEDCPPRVILLDLNLAKVNGVEVLKRIKADKRTRDISVVILTGSDEDRDMAECRRLGADHYIVKPVGFQNFSEITPALQFDWALFTGAGRRLPEKLPEGAD
jgi:CheY-like chemotaxis protein